MSKKITSFCPFCNSTNTISKQASGITPKVIRIGGKFEKTRYDVNFIWFCSKCFASGYTEKDERAKIENVRNRN
jgi:ribosomal protein L44E